ncbi:MAG TPA: HD domain-containing phosphohydrolase [Candidatus Limnocylindrales bacterium]|nr:HD domain-containing phosphohydrolase [Candidatus Limnocylindrales bacterium]
MRRLRWQLRAYILAVMTAAVAAVAVAGAGSTAPRDGQLVTLAILLVMASLSSVWPLHLSTKVKITVDDMPVFAAALVLSPLDAMLVAGASTLIGLRFRNTRMRWYNRGFNAAASTLGVGAAAVAYAALHGPTPSAMSGAIAIAGAGLAKYLTQALLVDLVVALQLKRRPLDNWLELHRRDIPYETALYLLGALAAVSVADEPLALVLFAVPMAAMLLALRESARVKEQTRATILELADLIDLRDPYTHGHSQRVAAYAERLARRMKLEPSQVALIHDAARVHDIGKIGTNDLVLLKQGPLDDSERAEMQRHVEIGHRLLSHIPEFFEGSELVLAHHERHDGKGYPRGLKGDELPIEVSVISVADSYDAMTTDRPYRRGLPWVAVRAELVRGRGTQWRGPVVDVFVEMIEEDRAAQSRAAELEPAAAQSA